MRNFLLATCMISLTYINASLVIAGDLDACIQKHLRDDLTILRRSALDKDQGKLLATKLCEGVRNSISPSSSFSEMCSQERIKSGHPCVKILERYRRVLAGEITLSKTGEETENNIDFSKIRMTRLSMETTLSDIKRFVFEHKKFPTTLAELDIRAGEHPMAPSPNRVKDAWGNEIEYSVQDNMVTLRSCGADGKPSGSGINADIEIKDLVTLNH